MPAYILSNKQQSKQLEETCNVMGYNRILYENAPNNKLLEEY